jgi:GntR family transcriptional regulator
VAESLGLGSTEEVTAIVRVRYAGDDPISVHRSWVPTDLAPDLSSHDLVNEQLCVVLESVYGLVMKSVSEQLEASLAGVEEARRLAVRPSSPVMILSDTIRDVSGQAFKYSRIVFRGDRIKLDFTYER